MEKIVIVRAKRIPQGKLLGGLSDYDERDLASIAAEAALEGFDKELVDLLVLGNVLSPQANLARQVGRKIGLPLSSSAYTINMVCASGLMAVMQAANQLRLGQATFAVCGGVESMTRTPYLLERARSGYVYGDAPLVDGIHMGLRDTLLDIHMGETAETLAESCKVDREAQDRFALWSHRKAVRAQENGGFAEELADVSSFVRDESPRAATSLEKLATLKTVFRKNGTVTAGNASGINDGAAMLLLCTLQTAEAHKLTPLAVIEDYATAGCDPARMGMGPVYATNKLLEQEGLSLKDFDTIELNEAFAAQVLACLREFGLEEDDERINPEGGAIALGHPLGASGARLLVHLAHRLASGKSKHGLATLCVGGGQGAAVHVSSTEVSG